MKKASLGIAVMAFMGAFTQRGNVVKSTEKISPPKPEQNKPSTSSKRDRPASMPEYYGYRKRPCEAINGKDERVDSSVKNALKQGWEIVNIPGVKL